MAKLNRTAGTRNQKKGFFIVVEGERTEKNYFDWLRTLAREGFISIHTIGGRKKNDAFHLCKKADAEEKKLTDGDELWIVCDHDARDLNPLFEWERGSNRHSVAISNPKFELWLAMHFDKCNGVRTPDECDRCLGKYIQNYEKNCSMDWVNPGNVQAAIANAKAKDSPACLAGSVPKEGTTTVYRLVENIVAASETKTGRK